MSRIDGRARRRAAGVELANSASALALDGGSLLGLGEVGARATSRRHVDGDDAFLDHPEPGSFDAQSFQILSLVYDGLVAYRRTGRQQFGPLVGDLARDVPEPSARRKAYVFTLRPGASASRTVLWFARRLPRVARGPVAPIPRPRASPPFDRRRASECLEAHRASAISHAGIVTDARVRARSLRLHTSPIRDLLHKLAKPVGVRSARRATVPTRQRPPGTGPYRIVSFRRSPRGVRAPRAIPHFKSLVEG